MIILASGSPRRKMLLESLGVNFTVEIPNVNEERLPGEDPSSMTRRLSELKAGCIARNHPGAIVIGADTIVVSGGVILGKPKSRRDAVRMLRKLSGREHEVITGLTVQRDEAVISSDEHTLVKFRELTPDEIAAYVSTGECDDKAGGYAAQGKGALLIEGIRGDYYNVVGLPLCKLGWILSLFGINLL